MYFCGIRNVSSFYTESHSKLRNKRPLLCPICCCHFVPMSFIASYVTCILHRTCSTVTRRRRVELEVHCDDDKKRHLEPTGSRHGLQRHLLILSVETLPVHLESSPLKSSLLTVCSRLRVGSRESQSLRGNLLYHLLLGI